MSCVPFLSLSFFLLSFSQYFDVWDHNTEGFFATFEDDPTKGYYVTDFFGPARNVAIEAITARGVTNIGIWGHSHGGGATYELSNALTKLKDQGLLPAFSIQATAYIDAVRYHPFVLTPFTMITETFNPFLEDRKPFSSTHANWYQTNPSPFRGTSVPGSVIDLDMSEQLPEEYLRDHVEIAIEVRKRKLLRNYFENEMQTR